MLVKIDLLTLIAEKEIVTAYFFDKESKIILSQNFSDQKQPDLAVFHNIIRLLDAETLYVELGYQEDSAKLHLLTKGKEIVKMDIPLKMAICLCGTYEYPIFIQHELLYKEGIMITKELIEDTLRH